MPNKSRFNVEGIIADYRAGLNTVQLGKKYGCRPSNIRYLLRSRGVEKIKTSELNNRSKHPPSMIHYMYTVEKKTLKDIADHYGVSYSTIGKRLRELGVPIRQGSSGRGKGICYKTSALPAEKIVADRLKGLTYEKLGLKYGVSATTIRNLIMKWAKDKE